MIRRAQAALCRYWRTFAPPVLIVLGGLILQELVRMP
jgi:hypothetical protein